jgi:hypothetical protein
MQKWDRRTLISKEANQQLRQPIRSPSPKDGQKNCPSVQIQNGKKCPTWKSNALLKSSKEASLKPGQVAQATRHPSNNKA